MQRSNILKIFFLLVFIGLLVFAFLNKDKIDLVLIKEQINSLGIFAPMIFIAIYVVAAIAFLPSFTFTMLGGLLFGTLLGGLYSLIGASLGAMISFLISRYFASDWLEKSNSGMIQKLREGSEKQGWKFLAFTRLSMVFPYNLQNYGFGLTKMSCFQFTLITFLTMAPSTFFYAYLGFMGELALN